MPWQSAELVVADVDFDDVYFHFSKTVVVAGEHGKTVAQQPTWISETQLLFICDKSGWLNPWTYVVGGDAYPVLSDVVHEEFGEPMWFLGGSSYAALDSELSIWTTVKDGLSCIYVLQLSSNTLTEIPSDFVEIRRVRRVDNSSVVFIAKSGVQPDLLVKLTYSVNQPFKFEVLKETFVPGNSVSPEFFSIGEPRHLENPHGETIHAFFYPPKNPHFIGLPSERPPCIVFIHGGPSARQGAGFDWIRQYYTSRGWAWYCYPIALFSVY